MQYIYILVLDRSLCSSWRALLMNRDALLASLASLASRLSPELTSSALDMASCSAELGVDSCDSKVKDARKGWQIASSHFLALWQPGFYPPLTSLVHNSLLFRIGLSLLPLYCSSTKPQFLQITIGVLRRDVLMKA